MVRIVIPLLVALIFFGPALAGDEPADLKQALALQRVMQKAIRDAEPAVACILVSRSDAYQRMRPGPAKTIPGKLGGFNPKSLADKNLARKLNLADPNVIPESFGSGVVIDAKGLILTNYHVVRDATKIFVRLPGGKSSYADIKAADPRSDLAVLELLTPNLGLKAITLGDASKCSRGQFVLSLANPFAAGFHDGQPSASWGILSNIRRRVPGQPMSEKDLPWKLQQYGTLLQTDARLNLGCSGGALINLRGEMIGLTTALAAIHGGETPGGFALPIDTDMQRIIDVLKRGEEVEFGFLGIIKNEMAAKGVVVKVISGSPAGKKLQNGDIIQKVNDKAIGNWDDLFLALSTQLAGSKITLSVNRFNQVIEKDVTLAKFYVPAKGIFSSLGQRPYFRGLRVDYTSLLVQQQPRLYPDVIRHGVLIEEVQPGSPAAKVDLKAGDIITQVKGRPIFTPAEFYREVAGSQGPVEVTLDSTNLPRPKVTLNP